MVVASAEIIRSIQAHTSRDCVFLRSPGNLAKTTGIGRWGAARGLCDIMFRAKKGCQRHMHDFYATRNCNGKDARPASVFLYRDVTMGTPWKARDGNYSAWKTTSKRSQLVVVKMMS